MNVKQKHFIQTLRAAYAWLVAHLGLFVDLPAATGAGTTGGAAPGGTTGGSSNTVGNNAGNDTGSGSKLTQQIAELGQVIEKFSELAAQQDGAVRAARGATDEARRLKVELVQHNMQNLADIAKSAIPDVVQMTSAFRMSTTPRDREGLLAAAEAMAKAGEQYDTTLVARGLPPTFVADLRAAATAYKDAIDAHRQFRASRSGAAKGIETAIVEGKKLILSVSVLIKARLRTDPAARAEWEKIKRVTLQTTRSKTPAAAAVPAVPPTDIAVPATGAAGSTADSAAPTVGSALPNAGSVATTADSAEVKTA